MQEYEIAVIGAGKTGRGFIGRLLQESSQPFLLIDKNRNLVEGLRREGSFEISFFGGKRSPLTVGGFEVWHTEELGIEEKLQRVKLIFVSVGGSNLKEVGSWLARVLGSGEKGENSECSVILCENANKPAEKLREAFLSSVNPGCGSKMESLFGFSESTIFCTTIEDEKNPLHILSENYPVLPCDGQPLKGNLPPISALKPIGGFENFLVRKLYTYNAASAAISYLGYLKGYTLYSDAANDGEILKLLKHLYTQVGKALCQAFGYTVEDQEEFAALSLRKFRDRTIADTIQRNAREPHRKLACNERIIGPARMVQEYGGNTVSFAITAAAALLYDEPSDTEWQKIKEKMGVSGVLEEVCKLELQSDLAKQILHYYSLFEEVKTEGKEITIPEIL